MLASVATLFPDFNYLREILTRSANLTLVSRFMLAIGLP